MNYNSFYRKKDRRKKTYTGTEKKNILKIILTYAIFIFVGIAVGFLLMLATGVI